jgi:uncharacterized membrane protein
MAAPNPFDPATVLFAKHAQHVVLIHFPIALFIVGVAFDLVGQWTKQQNLTEVAYYNLLIAAISTVPALVSGILAWQFALEGQKLKGILLLHLILAWLSIVLVWAAWLAHFRPRKTGQALSAYRFLIEIVGVGLISLTGHLGGFLSGVNGGV